MIVSGGKICGCFGINTITLGSGYSGSKNWQILDGLELSSEVMGQRGHSRSQLKIIKRISDMSSIEFYFKP
jgi:hypothetical protein